MEISLQLSRHRADSRNHQFEKCRFPIEPHLTDITIVRWSVPWLKAGRQPADTVRMSTADGHPAAFDQNCLKVLECYAVRDAAARIANTEYAGWLDRLLEVPGLEPSSLTSIHGFLIAQGLIRFEFTGRNVGLQYQLSSLGRESVQRKSMCLQDDIRSADSPSESVADGKAQAA